MLARLLMKRPRWVSRALRWWKFHNTKKFHLYFDDTGSRNPDHEPGTIRSDGYDCFGLGGILIAETDVEKLVSAHTAFCSKWDLDYPLHSTKIRGKRKQFSWLGRDENKAKEFHEELDALITELPIICIAAVVHRPGYVERYGEKYNGEPWLMCKTAFAILLERSAKFADAHGANLEVYFERAGRKEDDAIREYTKSLKAEGMPFDSGRSSAYEGFGATDFKRVILGEPQERSKDWPPIQIADLVLYPLSKAGYDRSYPPYRSLWTAERVIDVLIDEKDRPRKGVKYSCFEKGN